MKPDTVNRRLLAAVRGAFRASGLLGPETTLLVGVSGGADSLCLLHVLTRLRGGPGLHVAHLDHGLRGEEAAADARAVEEVCWAWEVPVTVTRREVRARGSVEDAARAARYRFFAETAQASGAAAVAVAHTADDQAETVLLHLLRGSGLTGLAGMAEDFVMDAGGGLRLRVIRPLLRVPAEDTRTYTRLNRLPVRQDSSNRSLEFTRNRVRAELLPVLRRFNPGIEGALTRLAGLARAEEDFWSWALPRLWDEVAIASRPDEVRMDRSRLIGLPLAGRRRLLREALRRLTGGLQGVQSGDVERILGLLAEGSGKRAPARGGLEAETERGALLLRRSSGEAPLWAPVTLPTPGCVYAGGWRLTASLGAPSEGAPALGAGPWVAVLDAALTGTRLTVRPRRPGDRYRPTGMRAPKKLQDILVDKRVPRRLRNAVPVIESAGGIAWVGGHRVAEECKMTERTQVAVEVRAEPVSEAASELAALMRSL